MLSAKNDLIFKMIFGDIKNKDILIGFLKSVLDIPHEDYDTITIVDPNLRIEKEKDKVGILDIKLKTKSGRVIDIEIQLVEMAEMSERVLFYTSKMITEQIKQGDKYYEIKKVISILILDHNMIKDKPKYNHKFLLHDKTDDTIFTDLLEIHTLELKKLPKNTDNTELYDWLSFFNAREKEEFNVLKERSEQIQKAVVILEQLSEDEQTRLLAEAHERKLRDEYSRLRTAERNGEKQKSIEIAKNLLDFKMDIQIISNVTGLTVAEIKEIQNRN